MRWQGCSCPALHWNFRTTGPGRHSHPTAETRKVSLSLTSQLVQPGTEAQVKPKSVILRSLCHSSTSHCCQGFLDQQIGFVHDTGLFSPRFNISPVLLPLTPCFSVSWEHGCTLTSVGFTASFASHFPLKDTGSPWGSGDWASYAVLRSKPGLAVTPGA